MQIGKQWSQVNVRTAFNGAVVVVRQDDREIILPASAVQKVAAAMRRKAKRARKTASA